MVAAIAALLGMVLGLIAVANAPGQATPAAAPVAHQQQPAPPTPTGPPLPQLPTLDPSATNVPGLPGWTPPTTTTPGAVPPIQIGPTTTTTVPPPTTTSTPSSGQGGQEDPAWYDIPGKIKKAINDWFRDLVSSALQAVLDTLVNTLLSTPDVALFPKITEVWSVTQGIANTIFVLLVVIGGVIVMSHETLQTRYSLKEIAPRVVVGFIAANASLGIVSQGIRIANALATAFLGQGASPKDLVTQLNHDIVRQIAGAGIFLLLLALVLVVLTVILLFVWIIRVALTVVVTIAGPLALVFHATPYTESVARLWWRAVIGLLAIQILQALTLIVALRTFFQAADMSPGVLSAAGGVMAFLAFLVLMYIEIKIPVWVFHHIWGGGRSTLATIAKYAVIGKALGAVGLRRHSGSRALRSHHTTTAGTSTTRANSRRVRTGQGRAATGSRAATGPTKITRGQSQPNQRNAGSKAGPTSRSGRPQRPGEPGRQNPKTAADRARERAARAYAAPQAIPARTGTAQPRRPAPTARTPQPTARTPASTARTPKPTAVTPPRISTTPRSGAITPPPTRPLPSQQQSKPDRRGGK